MPEALQTWIFKESDEHGRKPSCGLTRCQPSRTQAKVRHAQYEKNKEQIKKYKAQPEVRAANQTALKKYRSTMAGRRTTLFYAAKSKKKFDFNIEPSDIVIPSHCPVLGIPLDCAAKPHADNLPSLDRVDPQKGYVKGNVWVISWRANRIKSDATIAELKAIVAAIERQAHRIEQKVSIDRLETR